MKIDAIHVQPLDFIQEIQLGDSGHLTPAKWPSLGTIIMTKNVYTGYGVEGKGALGRKRLSGVGGGALT